MELPFRECWPWDFVARRGKCLIPWWIIVCVAALFTCPQSGLVNLNGPHFGTVAGREVLEQIIMAIVALLISSNL